MAGFQKAKREGIWIRVLIGGPSGSGKTYSGLRIATGLAKAAGTRVAAIDTENGRMRYYANEKDFDDMQLSSPFTPEKYVEAIKTAVDAGYKVLFIDSITHEWNWCCDTVNSMSGNSFQNWGKIKAQHHQKFAEAVIQAPIHIIATARGKDEYVIDDKDGKKTPRKIGAGIRQEDSTEYEYAVTFNLAQDTHIATAMKDNTHLFESRYEKLTEDDGVALYEWANSGGAPSERVTEQIAPARATISIDVVHEEIKAVVDNKIADGVDRSVISDCIKGVCGSANYKKITDIDTAKRVVSALNELEVVAE